MCESVHPQDTMQDLIFDVGMHKGEDTDYYLKKGFRVVAFEANPALVKENQDRFTDAIGTGQLCIIYGAIAANALSGGTIPFFVNRAMTVWGTVDVDFADRNLRVGAGYEAIEVPVVDFREALFTHGIPRYMKIDIEGMDHVCLAALKAIGHVPDYISIESEKVSFDGLVAELDALHDLGYTAFKAIQQFGMGWRGEPLQSREGRYVGYRFSEGASGVFGRDLPGHWLDYEQAVNRYTEIFRAYRRWGDNARINRIKLTRDLLYSVSKILRVPLPGWYDTHARHRTVSDRE